MVKKVLIVALILTSGCAPVFALRIQSDSTRTIVKKTSDFTITGDGKASNWQATDWITISKQESSTSKDLSTQVKVLYSDAGIYFLYRCEDERITATLKKDFTTLFKEDVIEVFLWPDQSVPVYFEYELSPLGYELPILIPNINGRVSGWLPWNYEGKRRIQHATTIQGGEKKSHATIKSWMAEFFIPFALLGSLISDTPKSGTEWRGNLYRIDYDDGYTTWTWQKTSFGKPGNFHEYKKFGTLIFE